MSDKITAELRTEFGKGAARRLRREEKIPAVVYGHGSDATHISLPRHETTMALRHHGKNAVLELVIDGKDQLALTKQVQVDDLKRVIEHIDFAAVIKGEKVTAEVPVFVIGDALNGTIVVTETNVLAIEADATAIPESLEVSVEKAEAGFSVLAKDVVLPAGVTLVTDGEILVVHVTEQRAAEPTAAEAESAAEAAAE